MGRHTQKRQEFLNDHPICCFCGGVKPSQEVDHVPGRVFFRNRQWPEGYAFPACVACNRATGYEEKVISLLARFSANDGDPDATDLEELANDIAIYDPEFMNAIRVARPIEIRQFLRQCCVAKPDGLALSEVPLIKIGPVVDQAVRKFARKLMLALWYKHMGIILSHAGGMRISWMTNASSTIGYEALENTLIAFPGLPTIIRNSQHLGDQFVYRYGLTKDNDGAGFLVWFRQSFGILGLVAKDKRQINSGLSNIEVPF